MTTIPTPRVTPSEVLSRLRTLRIIPVIVIDDASNAVPLATALMDGGLPCAEVTFRTATAAESIRRIAAECPGMLVGAGTVLTPHQASRAREAGASFVVAPGFNPAVVDYCLEQNIPVYPGVCTPTEIEMALGKGLKTLKFFPAEAAGGLPFLKAVAAPYAGVEFIPTGGITRQNLRDYLAFKRVVACGGSWLATTESIAGRRFGAIRDEAEQAMRVVRELTKTDAGGAR